MKFDKFFDDMVDVSKELEDKLATLTNNEQDDLINDLTVELGKLPEDMPKEEAMEFFNSFLDAFFAARNPSKSPKYRKTDDGFQTNDDDWDGPSGLGLM